MDDDGDDNFHDCFEDPDDLLTLIPRTNGQPPISLTVNKLDNEKFMPQLRDVLYQEPINSHGSVDGEVVPVALPNSMTDKSSEHNKSNGVPSSADTLDHESITVSPIENESTAVQSPSSSLTIIAEENQTLDQHSLASETQKLLHSDLIRIVVFCKALHRKCSAVGGPCIRISREARGLHTILRHIKYEFEALGSPLNRGTSIWSHKLAKLIAGCHFTMRQILHLVTKDHQENGALSRTPNPGMEFQISDVNQLGDLRLNLIDHKTNLAAFLERVQLHHFEQLAVLGSDDGSQLNFILDKIDDAVANMESTGMSGMNSNDNSDGNLKDTSFWKSLKVSLLAEGFSSKLIQVHENVLRTYLREGLDTQFYDSQVLHRNKPLVLLSSIEQQAFPHLIPNEPKSIRLGPVKRKAMSESTRRHWDSLLKLVRTGVRVRRIVETFLLSNNQPCLKCAAMRLTKEKFQIDKHPKHRQTAKAVMDYSVRPKLWEIVFPEASKFGGNRYYLGTLREIHSRTRCPFCRLIVRSLSMQPTLKLHDQDVESGPASSSRLSPPNSTSLPIKAHHSKPILEQDIRKWPESKARCYASFQIDGRVLQRDSDGKISGSRACTRRLRIHWDWQEFEDIHIVLTAAHIPETFGLFLGRTINSAWIGPEAFRQWTELCVQHHGSLCKSRTSDPSKWNSFFGVIDVIAMRLTSLPAGGRYVALSYVWGMGRPFMATQSNIKNLLRYDGFRKYISLLPRTIRDAIQLTRALGERFLWVDSLCIIQDSKRSWALNSRIMDLVYGNAYLTICAADGENSDAGLRGMDPTLSSMPVEIIEQHSTDVQLMCTQPAEQYIKRSVWNTRAWTLQERLLSCRTLIFVAGRVYFQCRCTARSADIITEDESAGWSIEYIDSPFLMLNQISHSPTTVYKNALQLYLSRKLTYDKDILAAFNGIGNIVCQALGGSLIHGLPSSHFDWALLWESRDAAVRRPNEDENEMFPSWSWCGWKGATIEYKPDMMSGCEENLEYWLMNHTWITWYIRDFNGNLRRVWEGDQTMAATQTRAKNWRGYHRSAERLDEKLYDAYGRCIKEEELDLPRSDFKLVLPQNPYGVNIVENGTYNESIAKNSPERDLPYLQFFTWSAFFRIQETSPVPNMGVQTQRYNILDSKDDWCGTIMLKRRWAEMLDPEKSFEFIAISEAKEFGQSEYDGWEYYIPKERDQSAWDLYYVLLIQYTNDIAYRVGLGKIFKDAFNHSCRAGGKEWKEFILG